MHSDFERGFIRGKGLLRSAG
ncbi:MAG: hypothetical protein RBT36_09145 [Desulfobulbus sp.]|nr:hypothetical protein [Desulfobulbus sp.]